MSDDVIIDLTNYKDRVGNRVVPGRYKVVVEDAETDTSAAGNPMVNVWFRVLDGDFEGATIVDRLTMTEKAMFRVVGFMQGIGLPTPKKRMKMNVRQFIGKVLEIDVEDGEPYNGRVKSEVRGYIRVAKAAAPVDDDPLEGLDEFSGGEEAEETTTAAAEPEAERVSVPDDSGTVDLDSIDLG